MEVKVVGTEQLAALLLTDSAGVSRIPVHGGLAEVEAIGLEMVRQARRERAFLKQTACVPKAAR